jgi:M6 family metalloprotease-like protein
MLVDHLKKTTPMRSNQFLKNGFLIPRLALALCLFMAASFLAFYSLAGPFSINAATAGQPPFPPVENRVTNGGVTLLARVFSPNGKVNPGETFPVVLTYQATAAAANVTITVTLHSASLFQQSTPAPVSGNGTAGSPLTYVIPALAPDATGQIVIEARAKTLAEDPEVMWKDVSADVTLAVGLAGPLPAKTHGPKVTTLESARYGDRPFPVVMVQYQDVKHCTGPGTPFPECTGDHTAAALDTAINSRSTGKSVWQLFQDMSFGQLYPEGRVSPPPNSPNTPFATTPAGHVYKWSTLEPSGTCNGTTLAPPTGSGPPLPPHINRIEGGWYLLPGTQGYYGADRTGHALAGALTGQGLLFGVDDACGPTGKLAYDSASLADPDIDYNDFDTDKDGIVDFFNLVFAGDGGNGTTTPSGLNNVWPHSSDLRSYFTDANGETGYVSNDQFRNRLNQPMFWTNASRTAMTTTDTGIKVFVRVGPYNVNPESAVESVSVIAHEYGHSLGLPDFYSTGSRATFGSWELMGSDHFQYMTIFSRQDMGWIVPRPLGSGQVTLRESKFDTGEIHWNRPDGTPYTLTGPGIHNADAFRLQLPPRILIDQVPSGVRAWYSQAGNDFGCPNDGGGHNLDFFIPDLQQHDGAASVTLKFKHLYEIEWDYDYAFVLVSRDGGETWTSLANGNTTPAAVNPNANGCQATYGNGFTGVSDGDPLNDAEKRATGDYTGATFVEETFDLSEYAGDNIILRFSYSTDPGLAKRGWFVDDIEITAGSAVVYKSDFEASDERTRIFPDGWVRVSSADGSPADHAFYIELRDRISNDFDGKGQSDRGVPTWEPGVSMIYTDEAHGYGNFGVDDPPAQTVVDSNPQPGSATPNLDDAAFTLARPTFNGCTHIENYDAEPGAGTSIPWILPRHLNFTVTGLTGLAPGAALPATPAMATLIAEVNPNCSVEVLPPVLSLGGDYQNPDPDGAYTLNWTRPATATGPDLLQVATVCGASFTEDGSSLANWEVTTEGTYAGVQWSIAPNNEKPNHSSTTFRARGAEGVGPGSAIMTYKNPLVIPEGGTTTLTWDDWSVNEGDDGSFVEVSDGGGTWTTIFQQSRSALAPDAAVAFADEPLFRKEVDLSAYRGKTISLRFRYFLGAENRAGSTPFGWYVDNVALNNANWADLTTTTATSFLDHKPSGSYCYRVRSTFSVGGASLPSAFSNIVTTVVASGVLPPPRLQNMSARARVLTGNNVLIGGFLVRDAPKRVVVRAIGPSLQSNGQAVQGRMTDPTLELHRQGSPVPIAVNDDWQSNQAEVEQTHLAPTNPKESAIVMTLDPGDYTAIMKGKNGETGIGLVEIYDIDANNAPAVLRNLSARAFVDSDDNVLIGGFIAGPTNTSTTRVVVRAIGPSLKSQVPEALDDTTLEVVDANGSSPITNDDWQQSPDANAITTAGLAPTHPKESAVMLPSLAAGMHTAIVRGKGNPKGVGLVELYNLP